MAASVKIAVIQAQERVPEVIEAVKDCLECMDKKIRSTNIIEQNER